MPPEFPHGSADPSAGLDSYYKKLTERITQQLLNGPATFIEVVRGCMGAYPTVVSDCLDQLSPPPRSVHLEGVGLVADTIKTDLDTSFLAQVEGNPALSSWYYTDDACSRIQGLQEWSSARIAFLGTPRLYEWFATRKLGKKRILLDLDKTILDVLGELAQRVGDMIYAYDAENELPSFLLKGFDYVFFDPPWYPEYYSKWLRRAAELAPGGTVMFSLFPELTRPTAVEQRTAILNELSTISRRHFILGSFTEHAIPSFERAELENSGLSAKQPWKLGDFVISDIQENPDLEHLGWASISQGLWEEVSIGRVRVFIDQKRSPEGPLLFLPSGALGILPSPSRRIPENHAANVLSSRGHGLATSQPNELVRLLHLLSSFLQAGFRLEEIIPQLPTDQETKLLLTVLCKE